MAVIFFLDNNGNFIQSEIIDVDRIQDAVDLTTSSEDPLYLESDSESEDSESTDMIELNATDWLLDDDAGIVSSPRTPIINLATQNIWRQGLQTVRLTGNDHPMEIYQAMINPRRLNFDDDYVYNVDPSLYNNEAHRHRTNEWNQRIRPWVPLVDGRYRVTSTPETLDVRTPPPTFIWDDDWGDIEYMFDEPVNLGDDELYFFSFTDVWGQIHFGDFAMELAIMTYWKHVERRMMVHAQFMEGRRQIDIQLAEKLRIRDGVVNKNLFLHCAEAA